MERSNIIGGSNVYPCKGDPLTDQEFVSHIEDYEHIKKIHKMQEFRQTSVQLTEKQSQLLKIEMRCSRLRDRPDPCWGYIEGQGKRCRCINGQCDKILVECNPTYTKEQAEYWTMTEEVKAQYGRPDKQKKYYLVDLVSDQEMLKYISDPEGAGRKHPHIKDPEPENPKEKEPAGRSKVIIGYEETYFGDADNQLSPIWGYVDDPEDAGSIVAQRYGSMKEYIRKNAYKSEEKVKRKEKLKVEEKIKAKKPAPKEDQESDVLAVETDQKTMLLYEKGLKSKLSESYQLTEITAELIQNISDGEPITVVLANEAEMAYVSGMFLQAGIEHDVETASGNENVCLWKADSKKIAKGRSVMVSGEFLKQGCSLHTENVWRDIQEAQVISELCVTGRDFFSFNTAKGVRWGCRNLYGTTHLVVEVEDFALSKSVTEEQKITLIKDTKNYIILSTSGEERLGVTNEALWVALESLKEADEISDFPKMISGLIISGAKDGLKVKGIGHMKFDEY